MGWQTFATSSNSFKFHMENLHLWLSIMLSWSLSLGLQLVTETSLRLTGSWGWPHPALAPKFRDFISMCHHFWVFVTYFSAKLLWGYQRNYIDNPVLSGTCALSVKASGQCSHAPPCFLKQDLLLDIWLSETDWPVSPRDLACEPFTNWAIFPISRVIVLRRHVACWSEYFSNKEVFLV